MNAIKQMLLISIVIFTLSGCGNNHRIKTGNNHLPLSDSEGYLGFMINTLDNLGNIQLKNTENNKSIYVGAAKKGNTVIMARVPEGEYCLVGFDVYDKSINFDDKGFCTYIEPGDINYFGEFLIRNPVTTQFTQFQKFVNYLNRDYPHLCEQFIGEQCKK